MEKRGFLLYPSYKEQIDMLSVEQKAELLDAIFDYQNGLEVGKLSDVTSIAFSFIKSQFDRDNEEWERVRQKRSQAGKLGGAPKGNGNASKNREEQAKQTKQASDCFVNEEQAKQTKQAVNVDVDVNVDVNENVDVKELVVSKDTMSEPVRTVFDEWNTLEAFGIPKIHSINKGSTRYKLLNKRLHDYQLTGVLKAIDNIRFSDFLQGNNNRGWLVKFDWFIKPDNFIKVLEGNYRNRGSTSVTQIDEFLDIARNGL